MKEDRARQVRGKRLRMAEQLTGKVRTQMMRKKGRALVLGYFLQQQPSPHSILFFLNQLLLACLSLKAPVQMSPITPCIGCIIKVIGILPCNVLFGNLGTCSQLADPLASLGSLYLRILLCFSGGLTLVGCQMLTQLLSHYPSSTGHRKKCEKKYCQSRQRQGKTDSYLGKIIY